MSEIYSAILTATVLPSDCTDEVIWESNDTTIATVTPIANTNTATVTAIKAGSCIITVTCGDYSDSCNVTVQASGPIRLTEIDLGNNYYINTNYIPKTTTKVEIGASTTYGQWATLVGSNTFFKIIWQNSSGQMGAELGTKVSKLTSLGAQIDEGVFIADFPNGTLTVNGTSSTAVTPTSTSTTYPLLVGTGYSSAGAIETPPATHNLQVQYLKIYESNVLVMDFYPTEVDGVEGLYDTIGKLFYGKTAIGVPVTDLYNLASYMSVLSSESYFNSNIAITPSDYTTEPTITVSPSGVVNVGSFNKSSNNQFRITPVANGDAIITSASNNGHSSTTVVHGEDAFTELEEVTTLRGDMAYSGGNWRCVSNRDAAHKTSVYKVEPNTAYTITFNKVSTAGPNFRCFIVGSTTNPRGYNWTLGNPTVHRDSTSPLTSADLVQTITTSSNEPYLLVNYMGDVTWTVTKVLSIYEHYEGIWFRWGTNWTENSSWNTDMYAVNPNSAYIINTANFGKIECSECPGADHLNGGSLGSTNWGKTLNVSTSDGMYYLYVSYEASNTATVTATSPIICTDLTLSETEYTFNAGDPGAHSISYVLTPNNTTQGIIVTSDTPQVATGGIGSGGIVINVGTQHGTTTIHVMCGSIHRTISVTNNA